MSNIVTSYALYKSGFCFCHNNFKSNVGLTVTLIRFMKLWWEFIHSLRSYFYSTAVSIKSEVKCNYVCDDLPFKLINPPLTTIKSDFEGKKKLHKYVIRLDMISDIFIKERKICSSNKLCILLLYRTM